MHWKSLPVPCNHKCKKKMTSHMAPTPSTTSNNSSQKSWIPVTRRSLFDLSSRKPTVIFRNFISQCKPSATRPSLLSFTPLAPLHSHHQNHVDLNHWLIKLQRYLQPLQMGRNLQQQHLQSSPPPPLPSAVSRSCLSISLSCCDMFSAKLFKENPFNGQTVQEKNVSCRSKKMVL